VEEGSKVLAAAFYIGGATHSGGEWYNNKITSNVPHIWIANWYGPARFDKIYNNTFIKAKDAPAGMKPIQMGSRTEYNEATATDIEFYSNKCQDFEFEIDATKRAHSYAVGWTLTIKLLDKSGSVSSGKNLVIRDNNGKEVAKLKTDGKGIAKAMLPEYRISGQKKIDCSSYTVVVGDPQKDGISKSLQINQDTEVAIKLK